MNQLEQNKMKTDQAWKQLYTRLDQDGLLKQQNNKSSQRILRISPVTWAAAIVACCILSISVYFIGFTEKTEKQLLTLQNTENATTLVTTLEDGSIVYLDNNSQLQYPERFAEEKREVSLQGNALFDVSGNRERPFLIETKDAQIEVIGTSFNVKSMNDTPFELSVRNGEVKVTSRQTKQTLSIKAGQTVTLASNGSLQIYDLPANNALKHYPSRIHFKDEKLADILNVVNKNEPQTIIQAAPSLANRKMTVTFDENTPDEMAEFICLALELKYTRESGIIMISEP